MPIAASTLAARSSTAQGRPESFVRWFHSRLSSRPLNNEPLGFRVQVLAVAVLMILVNQVANSVLDLCLHRLQFLGRGQPEGAY